MSADKNHKEDLEKYLKGHLGNEAKHSLEKEALDDPFLDEAMEGASAFKNVFADDLQGLEERISQKKKNILWLQIAASVLIIISVSVVVWFVSLNAPQETLVLKEEDVKEEPLKQTEDTSENIVEVPDEEEIEESLPSVLVKKEPASITHESQVNQPADVEEKEINKIIEPIDRTPTSATNQENDARSLGNNTHKLAVADSETLEEQKIEAVRSAPFAKAARMSAADEEIEVSLDVEITEETVVEEIVFEEAPEEEVFNLVTLGIEPLIGWEKYRTYLTDSLRFPQQAKRLGIEGRVFIQAIINSDGDVEEATVVKGIFDQCDQEALRLVKEGPKFTPDSLGRKGKVIIPVKF